jgi:hypothetical protein
MKRSISSGNLHLTVTTGIICEYGKMSSALGRIVPYPLPSYLFKIDILEEFIKYPDTSVQVCMHNTVCRYSLDLELKETLKQNRVYIEIRRFKNCHTNFKGTFLPH